MGQWPGTSSGNAWVLEYVGTDLRFYLGDNSFKSLGAAPLGQWHHVAISKEGSTTRIFLNGTQVVADYDMGTYAKDGAFTIGGSIAGGGWFDGKISNVRIVKGTAVYTSSFKPPTEPLTNITNTVLLCCNDSSQTGSTVTPGTITNNNSTASSDSPFDDPAGFKFGENGDQAIIKCGSYKGNGSDSEDIDVHLGWEPTWLLVKQTANSGNWQLVDSATSWPVSGNWETLRPNLDQAAHDSNETGIQLTATGFKVVKNYGNFNTDGDTHMFVAIRRPDPLVQKPQLATDVFAMDTGNGSSTIPTFDSGFPVDFALNKDPSTTDNIRVTARLMSGGYLRTNTDVEQLTYAGYTFDSNVGWANSGSSSSVQSWMWKRHAGFDVVAYKGNSNAGGVFQTINHNLGKTPEMIWIKNRTESRHWIVGHKGLDGGTNPWQHYAVLNSGADENGSLSSGVNVKWGNGAPNATHFNVGDWNTVNENDKEFIAMLFASVDGISKVGYYTGTGSAQTITLGFQPRFLIIKKVSATGDWYVIDSLRGWDSAENYIQLQSSDAQGPNDFGSNATNGITLSTSSLNNNSGDKYIYYAHA